MRSTSTKLQALAAGALAAGLVLLFIGVGSLGFRHFDRALVGYAIGTMIAAFAVGYRFMVWAQRPPSRMYFRRGFELLFRNPSRALPRRDRTGRTGDIHAPRASVPFPQGAGTLGFALSRNFVAQDFIRRRGGYRWIMHLCLSGGCTLAFGITFPLVFGWVHFESFAENPEMYRTQMLGMTVDSFSVHSIKAFLLFNGLNIAGILVLIGLAMAGYRRLTDAGERATQTFWEDILPLLIILAATVTGLALTVSYKLFDGRGHRLWAVVHMVSIVALLIYIPYGKLFHMFQRTCSLCVSQYKAAGTTGTRAHCRRCGEDFASQMHVTDLKGVLDELGFDYRFPTTNGEIHYQDICPPCRRRLLALNQGRSIGR